MNDQPTAADLTPAQLQQIHAQVSGTIGDFHHRAQDLLAQANELMDKAERENTQRLDTAKQEAARLREAAFIQEEVARQLADAARAATVTPQPPQQPPAAPQTPAATMPDTVQRVAGSDVPPMTLAGGPTPAGMQRLREVFDDREQGPPAAPAGPPPGGGAPFRPGPPPYERPL